MDVVRCSNALTNTKELGTNPGFLSLIIILVIFAIVFIIFCIKGYNSLKDNMENLIYKVYKKNKNINRILSTKNSQIRKKRKKEKSQRNKEIKKIKSNIRGLKNTKALMMDKKVKQKNIIIPNSKSSNSSFNNKNEEKKLFFETDYELNNSEYKDALKYDKRSACQYYYSLLKSKQLFIFTFLNFDDYNSGIIKKLIFFLSFALHYTINALFFNDSNMHQILIDGSSYNIKYQIPYIILSSFASIIILRLMLIALVLTDKYILEIKSQKNLEKAENKKKEILKCLIIKFIIFFSLNLILLTLFWYYLTCWNAIYENTQIYLLKNTLTSFGVSLLYPFIINIFPTFLRMQSLNGNECLYKASKIVQLL